MRGKHPQERHQRILFFTKYPPKAASSRLRTYQYLKYWEKEFEQIRVCPLLNERYLMDLYSGKSINWPNLLKCYFRRGINLLAAYKYDVVWIEKELFPYLPAWAEWVLSRTKGYIVDYDDAIFHNYDQNPSPVIRTLLSQKIGRVMRYSNVVFAGNPYLISYAQQALARSIHFLPTAIDPHRYKQKNHRDKLPVCIGWIGSPSTVRYLNQIIPVLEVLSEQFNITLIVVNGNIKLQFRGKLELIPWREEDEVESILKMDIGVMPLPDDPWERGKCAYKLIQYMACGIPVVASPVGFNKVVVSHGTNGYLADNDEDWYNYLKDLISDADKRNKMGSQGHANVMASYTLEKNTERIKNTLGSEGIWSKEQSRQP